jgi:formylglycine-generating enzyme required for sulfatase activity
MPTLRPLSVLSFPWVSVSALACAALISLLGCGGGGSGNPGPGEAPPALVATVHVPGGSFSMGHDGLEQPVHTVTLTPCEMARHEVTFERWTHVRDWALQTDPATYSALSPGAQGYPESSSTPQHPVTRVSWYDAVLWCNALSDASHLARAYSIDRNAKDPSNLNTDLEDPFRWTVTLVPGAAGYRLPTEAEFEYAARYLDGANLRPGDQFSGSSDADEVAWYMDNAGGGTHPVGQKKANELGISDLSGNVHEWLWDWRADYPDAPQVDPLGGIAGTERVQRGGSWENQVSYCQCSARVGGYPKIPATLDTTVGFRVCRR